MSQPRSAPTILMIDPAYHAALRTALLNQYGMHIKHTASGRIALELVRQTQPDLIVLSANLTDVPVGSLLAELKAQQLATPIILIGANGETTPTNFNYSNIVGWISQPVNASELAAMIQSALERSLPGDDLVLTKRVELIEANQQLTARIQQLQTLFEIGKAVTSQLELEAVLRQVVKAAVTLTDADESYLLLVDEVSGNLYLRAEANLGVEEVKNFWVKVSDSIAGRVVQSGEPVVLAKDSHSVKVKTGLVVYALVNTPVKVGSQVIGVLGIDNRYQQRAFNQQDQLLLATLADWAAKSPFKMPSFMPLPAR
ncbi:MAG: GAF domain-containing protein [Anaerolineae bacterium]